MTNLGSIAPQNLAQHMLSPDRMALRERRYRPRRGRLLLTAACVNRQQYAGGCFLPLNIESPRSRQTACHGRHGGSSRRARCAGAGTADGLKKFKDLLDSGVITREELDAKKKELLGL